VGLPRSGPQGSRLLGLVRMATVLAFASFDTKESVSRLA
jgi:hypothetical protein